MKLNRIYLNGSHSELLYFEEAHNPIFSVEARVPTGDEDKNPRSEYKNPNSAQQPESWEDLQNLGTILIRSIDLRTVDLFGPKFQQKLSAPFDWMVLENRLPRGWNKILVSFYVCDDTNGDGKCSDESLYNQATSHTPVFKACHGPSAVVLGVYSFIKSKK